MRLIDADALKAIFDGNPFEIACQDVANIIDEQTTIAISEDGFDDAFARIEKAKAVIPEERSEDPSHPFADSVMMGERSEE